MQLEKQIQRSACYNNIEGPLKVFALGAGDGLMRINEEFETVIEICSAKADVEALVDCPYRRRSTSRSKTGIAPFAGIPDSSVVLEVATKDKRPGRQTMLQLSKSRSDHVWVLLQACYKLALRRLIAENIHKLVA
ncbi:hypothetical protein BDV93DRAFT_510264 [Ceratobasidium sp. AG-I]|nr:hypothetical protein BDV93DRAFT_510264 [Ceratobasidium sp. AG-I]